MRVVRGVSPKQLSEIVAFVVFESPLPSAHKSALGRASPQLFGNFEHNVAAQVLNHDFFWESMQPGGGNLPTSGLMQQIENDFGS
nr:superoxide dismutase [Fe] 3, chloroplastic [Tanacetum cinerariifolium]